MQALNRQINRRTIEKCIEAVNDARFCIENKLLEAAADRIYMAIHHSVQALAIKEGFTPAGLQSRINWFGAKYVYTGKVFPEIMLSIYSTAFVRKKAFESGLIPSSAINAEQIHEAFNDCRHFVKQVFNYLQVDFPEE